MRRVSRFYSWVCNLIVLNKHPLTFPEIEKIKKLCLRTTQIHLSLTQFSLSSCKPHKLHKLVIPTR